MKLMSFAVLFVSGSICHASDQIPGAPQLQPIALTNAIVHPISAAAIENCTLVFDQGRITDLGEDVQPPEDAEVIDLNGLHVYPSLIEAHSQLGLTEISSTRATLDFTETGLINPNVSAHLAVNPDSELIPVTRANGVLIAVSAPTGGLVSGKASVIQLDGWTPLEMTLKPDVAMVVNWPLMQSPPRKRSGTAPEPQEKEDSGKRAMKTLRTLFEQARTYRKARAVSTLSQAYDIRLDAMQPVLDRTMPLLVAADRVEQIQSAVAFGVEQNIKIIIFGGYDAISCAALLREYRVPIVIDAIHKDPRRDDDNYDAAFTLPERLHQAGLQFCISGSSRSETLNARNLPYQAATAVAYGLPYDEALKSVTLYPAEILGIDDRVGTLQPGKDATLFVCDGDPLETETQVSAAWIQGRKVDLSSRHTQLYDKYSEKYRQLKEADSGAGQ